MPNNNGQLLNFTSSGGGFNQSKQTKNRNVNLRNRSIMFSSAGLNTLLRGGADVFEAYGWGKTAAGLNIAAGSAGGLVGGTLLGSMLGISGPIGASIGLAIGAASSGLQAWAKTVQESKALTEKFNSAIQNLSKSMLNDQYNFNNLYYDKIFNRKDEISYISDLKLVKILHSMI